MARRLRLRLETRIDRLEQAALARGLPNSGQREPPSDTAVSAILQAVARLDSQLVRDLIGDQLWERLELSDRVTNGVVVARESKAEAGLTT